MGLLKILIPLGVFLVILAVVVPIVAVFTRQETEGDPLVNTTVGYIRGLRAEDGSAMFLGIPYAIVDKQNPFGAAIPNPIFEDVFNAITDSARCPQTAGLTSTTLDCLQLNVYVPKTAAEKPLPVLVYVHGGGFTSGSSDRVSFGPKFLIRHDVILVALNYRLGVYGFMCLHTPNVPGNQGLKDQQNALRWIKNNIKAFGGDDENITIDGDSAGGVAVDLQLLFADEGLFHKVITQSGTSLAHWAVREPDLEAPFKIARQLGFETTNLDDAVAFISNQTSNQVIIASAMLSLSFGPCLEMQFPGVESFITTHPVNTPMRNAEKIPLLAGYNEDEMWMTFYHLPASIFEFLDIFNSTTRDGFDFGEKHDVKQSFVRRFYVGDEPMSAELRRPISDFQSDFMFTHPTQRSLGKYLEHGGTAYHYVFTYVGGRNMLRRRMNITTGGAVHADELAYLFEMPDMPETPTAEDQLIIDRITTLWTNFAKYGNPTPEVTPLLPVLLPPVTASRLSYLNLTIPLSVSARPFRERLAFLDLFYAANRQYVRGYKSSNETYVADLYR